MRKLILISMVALTGCAGARFSAMPDAVPTMTAQEAYNQCKPEIRQATYSNRILPGGFLNPMNAGRQDSIDAVEGRCMAQYGYRAEW